ncbi:Transmembrane protein 62 [Schistosoma japonicum]|nr:Transmembrane protein 62 [Schistosoma japonicum]
MVRSSHHFNINIDAFNVPSWGANGDYYSHFGVKGQPPLKSYIFKLIKPYGQYSFISVDLTLEPGIKWPFNFFGNFNLDVKKQLLKSVNESKGSNQTFIFGHHPTSTVVSSDLDMRSLIGDSAFAYLCGHLHTLHGLTKKIYYLQPQGYWEWELGDWRENRYYRIVAVDHDLVSFVDVRKSPSGSNKEWPIILITNPKNAQFSLPSKEPLHRIELSTHIRVLVWSLWPIQTVSISIDGIHLGNAKQANSLPGHSSTPLYVLPWNTSRWSSDPYGFHLIEVTAKDVNGNQRTVVQSFSFRSASHFPIGLLSKFIISVRLSVIVSALYYTIWIVIFILLMLPLLLRRPHLLICLFRTRLGRGMYQISSTKKLVYPVLIFMVYHISCPLFMGFLVADKFGFFFSFGIYIDGIFLPEKLSYVLASAQLLGFGLYLSAFAVHCGKRQCDSMYVLNVESVEGSSNTTLHFNKDEIHSNAVYAHLSETPFSPCMLIALVIHIVYQFVGTIIFVWIPYGFITVLLSPGCVMPVCVACILFYNCPRPDHVKNCVQ